MNGGDNICYGYVFARGGSKGIPGKNIRPLCGKPLIAYSIEALKASRHVRRVIVSTDDENIAKIAAEYGAEVPFKRPAELASDSSPEILAWKHALSEAEREGAMPDIFVSAPTTSPLREPGDIDAAVDMLARTDADIVISVTPSSRSPYFNMVTRDEAGRSRIFAELPGGVDRRQDAPLVYDMTTVVYAAKSRYVKNCRSLMEGDVRSIIVPAERAADIDTQLDFDFAEFLIRRRMGI
ncbi:MAG: acylneuraminate cytidylyltransferase family protein [Synergistaceae bacterium]|jgi:N-acylneuraminate cytidylyltransferase|nr:acylneuraminate cytidylyltransferase family protein [Synergistaceae bacterium]